MSKSTEPSESRKARLSPVQVCKSKVKYYNAVSAERARKVLSKEYKTEFTAYRCGDSRHYHLTHANPLERIGHGNK